nr:hypothetical protein GCM10020092_082340 [Actinoplanes digitatis]
MKRLSGRGRSALIIGVQGIRARKLRTLLSMVSLFLGVLAVVVVQAGASIAERALFAGVELSNGIDGTKVMDVPTQERTADIVLTTLKGRSDATAMLSVSAIIGEPGVTPVNEGGSPFDEHWGPSQVCYPDGTCEAPAAAPPGQAIQVQLTAMTADIRPFRPFRPKTGDWLDFSTVPALAPRIVINLEAAKGFARYKVPAEMRVGGAAANITPQIVGVVDDGAYEPHAYVRLDELANWLPPANLADPNTGGGMQVLLANSTPVEQVLTTKLRGAGAEIYVNTVNSREQGQNEIRLLRLVFLAMAKPGPTDRRRRHPQRRPSHSRRTNRRVRPTPSRRHPPLPTGRNRPSRNPAHRPANRGSRNRLQRDRPQGNLRRSRRIRTLPTRPRIPLGQPAW